MTYEDAHPNGNENGRHEPHHGKPHLKITFDAQTKTYHPVAHGDMPLMPLIGAIVRVQTLLVTGDELAFFFQGAECGLFIYWDVVTETYKWHCSRGIPRDPLLAVLETLKFSLTAQHMQQQAARQQSPILGPNGQPIRRF